MLQDVPPSLGEPTTETSASFSFQSHHVVVAAASPVSLPTSSTSTSSSPSPQSPPSTVYVDRSAAAQFQSTVTLDHSSNLDGIETGAGRTRSRRPQPSHAEEKKGTKPARSYNVSPKLSPTVTRRSEGPPPQEFTIHTKSEEWRREGGSPGTIFSLPPLAGGGGDGSPGTPPNITVSEGTQGGDPATLLVVVRSPVLVTTPTSIGGSDTNSGGSMGPLEQRGVTVSPSTLQLQETHSPQQQLQQPQPPHQRAAPSSPLSPPRNHPFTSVVFSSDDRVNVGEEEGPAKKSSSSPRSPITTTTTTATSPFFHPPIVLPITTTTTTTTTSCRHQVPVIVRNIIVLILTTTRRRRSVTGGTTREDIIFHCLLQQQNTPKGSCWKTVLRTAR